MEYIKIENSKIVQIISTNDKVDMQVYKPIVFEKFEGHVGMLENRLNWDTLKKKSTKQLLDEGLIKDVRGKYYDKNTKNSFNITQIDAHIPENLTKKSPKSKFDVWDASKNNWIKDKKREKEHLDFVKYSKQKARFSEIREIQMDLMEEGKTLKKTQPDLYKELQKLKKTILDYESKNK